MASFIETGNLIIEIPFNGIHLDKIIDIVNNFSKNKYNIYKKIYESLTEEDLTILQEVDFEDMLSKPKYDVTFNLLIFPKKLPDGRDITVNSDSNFTEIIVNIC